MESIGKNENYRGKKCEFEEGKCQNARDLNGPKTGSIFFLCKI